MLSYDAGFQKYKNVCPRQSTVYGLPEIYRMIQPEKVEIEHKGCMTSSVESTGLFL